MSTFDHDQSNGEDPIDGGPRDAALERLLSEARWPGPTDESVARLTAEWDALCADSDVETVSDAALDQVLPQATWPTAGAESIVRLNAQWDSLGEFGHGPASNTVLIAERLDRVRNLWRWCAAATVLLAVGGAVWWGMAARTDRIVDHRSASQPVHRPFPVAIEQPATTTADWRPPNAYEMLVVTVVHRQRTSVHKQDQQTASRLPGRRMPADQDAQMQFAAEAPASQHAARRLAGLLQRWRQTTKLIAELSGKRAEKGLAERVRSSTGAQQLAALRVLVPMATERSLPLLREAWHLPDLSATVLPALLRLEGSANLGQLALAEADQSRRQEIMATLWQREDPEAVTFMFRLVSQGTYEADAAAALRQSARPPLDWLCQVVVGAPQTADRTKAAELLGQLESPEVTRRLVNLTQDAAGRQAALAGLLASAEPSARQFLAAAENDPYLIASLRTVRRHQTNFPADLPGEQNHGTP